MEDSQQKLNDAISGMADNLHRNYLRRIYVSRRVFLCELRRKFLLCRPMLFNVRTGARKTSVSIR